jgi:hypothetical protein
MGLMTARYPGTCKGCGQRFGEGTQIDYRGRGKTYHAECPIGRLDVGTRDVDPELVLARREAAHEDAEYARGVADADRYRANRDLLGEDYAAAEDLAWELKDPSY